MDYKVLIDALKPAARQAGEKIMAIYSAPPKAVVKDDGSPVTEADKAAERILLAALESLNTGISIISEENAASHKLAAPDRFFLVDPLDGTKEFLKRDGKGSFTVNIALVERGVPAMGIVFAPALDRLFSGAKGIGATEENLSGTGTIEARPITVRQPVKGKTVAVASVSHRDAETEQWLQDNNVSETVSIGSSLKFCLVAAAEADVYPRFGPTMEWDTAAGDAVLRAAGGRLCEPDGQPFVYGKPDYRNGAFVAWGGR